MSARDDHGSDWHGGGGGNRGNGAGGLGNGGVGGGMGGGNRGGGAGHNGGIGNRTGLSTGTTWHGNTAFGQAGGNVQAYGTRRPNGQMVDMRNPDGTAIRPAVTQGPLNRPATAAAVPGLLDDIPVPASVPQPSVIGFLPGWPGTGMWWGNKPHWNNNAAAWPSSAAVNSIVTGSTGYAGYQPGQQLSTGLPSYDPDGYRKQFYDRVPEDPNGIMSGSY